MTQLESTPESSPQQSTREVPKDTIKPPNDRSAPAPSESTPGAALESSAKGKDELTTDPPPLTTNQPNEGYRPPEAVPNSEPAFTGDAGGSWRDPPNNDTWVINQATSVWDKGTNSPTGWPNNNDWSDTERRWGEVPPNTEDWGNLGVLGADDPWRDNSDKWWDKDLQRTQRKPGPGMLAPRAIEIMHDSDHILYEVSISGDPGPELSAVTPPKPSVPPAGALNAPSPSAPATPIPAVTAPATAATAGATELAPEPVAEVIPHVLPTTEELRDAIPHPSALFCRRHFGWFIMSITTASATASHLGTHWCSDPDKEAIFDTLPNPQLRTEKDCLERETSPSKASLYGAINWSAEKEPKMHHFHVYRNVVAGSGLYPPLKRQIPTGSSSLAGPSSNPSGDVEMTSESQVSEVDNTTGAASESSWDKAPTEEHLDLYMCCQCKTQVLCSPDGGVIPCIVPADAIEGFVKERASQPKPGQTPEQSTFSSLEMLLRLDLYFRRVCLLT